MATPITYLEAIRRALKRALNQDSDVIMIGEDIGAYGGAFKLTDGFLDEFGQKRIIDTPIAETGLVGAAIGAAMAGLKPIVEIQFIDFISCAFNQLTNFAATSRFRWQAAVPIVVRGPSGGGVHAGPFHSQMIESFFLNTPGLKIVIPSTPTDAYRLLLGAIEDPDPVLFLEQKALYRTLKEEVDESAGPLAPGKAVVRKEGTDLSIVSYGAMVHRVLEAATLLEGEGISAEVLDLRSLAPLDKTALIETAKKTGRVLIAHEDNLTGGAGGELVALIAEHAFEWLDAPIQRIASLDIPIPYAAELEDSSLPNAATIAARGRSLAEY